MATNDDAQHAMLCRIAHQIMHKNYYQPWAVDQWWDHCEARLQAQEKAGMKPASCITRYLDK